jgi:hypothetical protein
MVNVVVVQAEVGVEAGSAVEKSRQSSISSR